MLSEISREKDKTEWPHSYAGCRETNKGNRLWQRKINPWTWTTELKLPKGEGGINIKGVKK